MKWAKVANGVVYFVWPWTKVMPDGTEIVKELPEHYSGRKKARPDCIVQVSDEVQKGWLFDGKNYKPVVKGPPAKAKLLRDIIREEIAAALSGDKKRTARAQKKN